jgi:hypothetical protein
MEKMHVRVVFLFLLFLTVSGIVMASGEPPATGPVFPPSLESYGDTDMGSIIGILANRVRQEPFNLIASLIFFVCHHPHLSHRAIHGHRTPMDP